jgi:hypothetical protein
MIQLTVQAHLAEFAALRQEVLELIKWGDQLVFISLATSGALFSFAFSATGAGVVPPSRRLALYLIPALSTAIGGLWISNGLRIARISAYLRDVLAPRVNASLATVSPNTGDSPAIDEVLTWESSHQRDMHRWSRRLFEGFAVVMSFFFTGVLAQVLILQDSSGSILDRIRQVESPTAFGINSVILFSCLVWLGRRLMRHVITGWKRHPDLGIRVR